MFESDSLFYDASPANDGTQGPQQRFRRIRQLFTIHCLDGFSYTIAVSPLPNTSKVELFSLRWLLQVGIVED